MKLMGRQRQRRADGEVTVETVEWAYRLFLDREPESAERVAEKAATWQTTRQLRVDFMTSEEFRVKNPDLALTNQPTTVIKEIAPGLRLYVDLSDQVVGMGIVRGTYEAEEIDFVRRHLRPGDTALDVGANVGLFTIHMADAVGARGRVHSFEPYAPVADLLARSVAENRFEARVELVRAAASDRTGWIQLFAGEDSLNHAGSFLLPGGEVPEVPGMVLEVATVALDAHPVQRPVSLIKIDVEGAEALAFRGADHLLRQDRPLVLAELNPSQLARVSQVSPEQLLAEMAQRGYDCRTLSGARVPRDVDGVLTVVFAPR
jgi:FkbM family methyltransferase